MAKQCQNVDDVRELVSKHDIEFIFASFSELRGKSCAKLIPAKHLDDLFESGAGFAGFAAGELGQGAHSPDAVAMPDPRSFRVVPWRRGLAHIIGDVQVEGQEFPYCPRTILRRQIERAAEKGYVLKVGFEPEFMLVDFDDDGELVVADRLDRHPRPCYDVKGLSRSYDLLTTLSKHVSELGWNNYAVDHEDGRGQFEVNVEFADALETADRAIFFRYMVDQIAHEHGVTATFMPKPFTHNTGNGFHLTMSLWDATTDTNLFDDPDDPRGLGLSQLGYQFVSGLLDHARGYAAIAAPTVNSYKRLKAGTENIRTWVPVCLTYGGNNRTQMVRIARGGAIEDRTPDFSGSPYLTLAAALACGIDGIERGLEASEPNEHNLYDMSAKEIAAKGIKKLPGNLLEATHYLQNDSVLREAFGTVPVDTDYGASATETEAFVDYYARMKQEEHHDITDVVTRHEIERYLSFP